MTIENRKARFDYDIIDTFVAGIVLEGWEVKSIRNNSASIKGAWVTIRDNEAWLENASVSPWKFSQGEQKKIKPRKLLLKKTEIKRITQKFKEKNYTAVPLKIFNQNGFLKCEVALVKGRKKYEKKQVLKERSEQRAARQAMKGRY